jgi:hypothetical protein
MRGMAAFVLDPRVRGWWIGYAPREWTGGSKVVGGPASWRDCCAGERRGGAVRSKPSEHLKCIGDNRAPIPPRAAARVDRGPQSDSAAASLLRPTRTSAPSPTPATEPDAELELDCIHECSRWSPQAPITQRWKWTTFRTASAPSEVARVARARRRPT